MAHKKATVKTETNSQVECLKCKRITATTKDGVGSCLACHYKWKVKK